MAERILTQGNVAAGWGALAAGCQAYFGYPITPQNEITEWMSREFPKRGKVFLQTASETGSINMLFGAVSTGFRAMTSTSGPGWGLMQESLSHAYNAEVSLVIVLVQRGGPGQGTTRQSQMDYLSATKGGGQGGHKNIVLAPASVQETYEQVQLAFHIADKYRTPVVVLSDALIGQMYEPLEMKTLEFPPLPEKDWPVRGIAYHKDGKRRLVISDQGLVPNPPNINYLTFLQHLEDKMRRVTENEVRYETHLVDDAKLILVAFGYVARISEEAVNQARRKGLKVGLIRPISLWPFPYQVIKEYAKRGANFLVVEDNLGMMVDDVRLGVEGKSQVNFLGALAHHVPTDAGRILPDRVLSEIEHIYKGG